MTTQMLQALDLEEINYLHNATLERLNREGSHAMKASIKLDLQKIRKELMTRKNAAVRFMLLQNNGK